MKRSRSSSQIPIKRRSSSQPPASNDRQYKLPARSASRERGSYIPSVTASSRKGNTKTSFSSLAVRPRNLFGSSSYLAPTPKLSQFKSPTFSKNVSNKKFQSDLYQKLCTYIRENELTMPLELKPFNITSFIIVINHILKHIGANGDIFHTHNFKEGLLSLLKNLGYPGNISMSTLKSVNTNHAWPHIMLLISWLIDLGAYIKSSTAYSFQNPLFSHFNEYFVQAYISFNKGEGIHVGAENLTSKVEQYLNIDREEIEKTCADNEKLHASVRNLEINLEEQIAKNQEYQKQVDHISTIDKTLSKLNQRKQELTEKETELKLKINRKKLICEKLGVPKLEKLLKTQMYSKADKQTKINEGIELQRDIELTGNLIAKKQQAIEMIDADIAANRRSAQELKYNINEQISELSFYEKTLQNYTLTGDKYDSEDFKQQVTNLENYVEKLSEQYLELIAKLKKRVENLDIQSEKFTTILKQYQDKEIELNETKDQKIIEYKNYTNTLEKRKNEHRNLIKQLKDNINSLHQEIYGLTSVERETNDLLELKLTKQCDLVEYYTQIEAFFQNIEGIIAHKMAEMKKMFDRVIEAVENSLEDVYNEQENIIENLKKPGPPCS